MIIDIDKLIKKTLVSQQSLLIVYLVSTRGAWGRQALVQNAQAPTQPFQLNYVYPTSFMHTA